MPRIFQWFRASFVSVTSILGLMPCINYSNNQGSLENRPLRHAKLLRSQGLSQVERQEDSATTLRVFQGAPELENLRLSLSLWNGVFPKRQIPESF